MTQSDFVLTHLFEFQQFNHIVRPIALLERNNETLWFTYLQDVFRLILSIELSAAGGDETCNIESAAIRGISND